MEFDFCCYSENYDLICYINFFFQVTFLLERKKTWNEEFLNLTSTNQPILPEKIKSKNFCIFEKKKNWKNNTNLTKFYPIKNSIKLCRFATFICYVFPPFGVQTNNKALSGFVFSSYSIFIHLVLSFLWFLLILFHI